VVVLTGARQTGKTSTFLRLFPNHKFVSLDLPSEAEQAEREPQRFLQRHPPPVIIDEVEYAPVLFRYLKVAVDASRNRNGQFLLTGSQKFTRMKSVSESLAGKADMAELETLSWRRSARHCRQPYWKMPWCGADFRSCMRTRTSMGWPSTTPI
jgi:uncharacterized protein